MPELIGEDLIGNRPSIVVAGTHGKTTTTALTAFSLQACGINPGYLIGGVPLDLSSGNELGDLSAPFVIEGMSMTLLFLTSVSSLFIIGQGY